MAFKSPIGPPPRMDLAVETPLLPLRRQLVAGGLAVAMSVPQVSIRQIRSRVSHAQEAF